MLVPTPEHIILASDVAALSNPNRSILFEPNRLCGNSADGGEGAWGTLRLMLSRGRSDVWLS